MYKVKFAVTALLPAAVPKVSVLQLSTATEGGFGGNLPFHESDDSHQYLINRPWGVAPFNGSVQKWFTLIFFIIPSLSFDEAKGVKDIRSYDGAEYSVRISKFSISITTTAPIFPFISL